MAIDLHWLSYLGIAAAWTTAFSMSTRPAVRGYRNFGILASYILGIVMPFRIGLTPAMFTWAICGLIAGILYLLYDFWTYAKATQPTERPRFAHLVFGLLAWPIMFPEVVEYSLAELGILRSPTVPSSSDSNLNEDNQSKQLPS